MGSVWNQLISGTDLWPLNTKASLDFIFLLSFALFFSPLSSPFYFVKYLMY